MIVIEFFKYFLIFILIYLGSVIRLKNRLLYTTFLNHDFCLITGPSEMFKDANKDSAPSSGNTEKILQNKVIIILLNLFLKFNLFI